jgi:predicted AAA+ superfamily ATPase
MLNGARQVGKTTLAKQVAEKNSYHSLDDPQKVLFAREDPREFIRQNPGRMVIDEIQKAPELIPWIKMQVDEDLSPGRFLLTGSANVLTLPKVSESLAGRMGLLRLFPLTQGEIAATPPTFLDRLEKMDFPHTFSMPSRKDLLEIVLRGGYPQLITKTDDGRQLWYENYINSLLVKDLTDLFAIRKVELAHKLLLALAGWSSKVIILREIGSALGVAYETLQNYIGYLQSLYIIDLLPPWTRTDYGRIQQREKIFISDTGLMAAILNLKANIIYGDSDRVGKFVETFVFNELSAQIGLQKHHFRLYHYRDHSQREIDFIIECPGGLVMGIEVKAGSNVCASDFQHLKWFAKEGCQGRPFGGIVLYGGTTRISMGENLIAIPIAALWL